MKIIKNKVIPFYGFAAINLFGLIFTRKDLSETQYNHEAIHSAQGKELLWIFFYILYLIFWIYNLFKYKFNNKNAYHNIPFEKEAYENQSYLKYLEERKHYNWL